MLKRYVVIELLFGVAVVAAGFFFPGPILPVLGGCMIALAAQCCVYSDKHHWAVVAFGLLSLLVLTVSGGMAFFHFTSLSGYEDSTSPLSVLLVLAVVILGHSSMALPVEDRPDLGVLQRGISRMTAFAGIGFVSIVLTYLLSYALYGTALAALLEGETVQDFHYLEGIFALTMALTSGRALCRAFWGKEQLTDGSEGAK